MIPNASNRNEVSGSNRVPRPWLSLITVHKNDPQGLQRTLECLAEQGAQGVEHIVVDGSDRILVSSAVRSLLNQCETYWVDQSSTGIYGAMNEGLSHSVGKYLFFLNAGDELADPLVLSELRDLLTQECPDWLYGRLVLVSNRGRERVEPRFDFEREQLRHFRSQRFPKQSASIVKRELILEVGGFDEELSLAADYQTMLLLTQRARPLEWGRCVTRFQLGGQSSTSWQESLRQAHSARVAAYSYSSAESVTDQLLSVPQYARALLARVLRRV